MIKSLEELSNSFSLVTANIRDFLIKLNLWNNAPSGSSIKFVVKRDTYPYYETIEIPAKETIISNISTSTKTNNISGTYNYGNIESSNISIDEYRNKYIFFKYNGDGKNVNSISLFESDLYEGMEVNLIIEINRENIVNKTKSSEIISIKPTSTSHGNDYICAVYSKIDYKTSNDINEAQLITMDKFYVSLKLVYCESGWELVEENQYLPQEFKRLDYTANYSLRS